MCVCIYIYVHVNDIYIKKKLISGIPYIQIILENLAIWHWFGTCVDLGWGITNVLCAKCFFLYFELRTNLAIPCSLQFFFATWFFCHCAVSLYLFPSMMSLSLLYCFWGRQICPQSCYFSVLRILLAKTNPRMENSKIAHSWYCT